MSNTKPTIRELLDDIEEAGAGTLAERVEAVLRLHYEGSCGCKACYASWPCPTIRALEGEESR